LVGAPIWLKPLTFAVSSVLVGMTLAWMISPGLDDLSARAPPTAHTGLGHVVAVTSLIKW
jgi:hypothetical protein